jgi:hypothetical protein
MSAKCQKPTSPGEPGFDPNLETVIIKASIALGPDN